MTTIAEKRGLRWDALLHRYVPTDGGAPITRREAMAMPVLATAAASLVDPLGWDPSTHRYIAINASVWDAADAGITFNGITDDYAAWSKLIAAIGASQAEVTTSPGLSAIGTNLTIPSNITINYQSGAKLAPATGVTVQHNAVIRSGVYQIFAGLGTVKLGRAAVAEGIYPEWWGAKVDGATDESAAWASCIAAIPSSGAKIWCTPGSHYFTTAGIAINGKTDIAILGSGPNASMLVMGAAGFYVISVSNTCSRISILGVWIGSFAARATGGGINVTGLTGAHSDNVKMIDVIVQNVPNPIVMAFTDDWRLQRINVTQTIAGATVGNGITMHTAISGRLDDIAVTAVTGTLPAEGINIDYDCDTIDGYGIEVGGCAGAGIRLQKSAGATGPRLVRLFGALSESNLYGFRITDCRLAELHGCHAAVNTAEGYLFSGGTGVKVFGGDAQQNGTVGYYLDTAALIDTVLDNVTATNNGTSAANTYDGCRINDNVTNVTVLGGVFADFVTSPSTQRYGLSTSSTGTDYLTICSIRTKSGLGNLTGGLGNFSVGTHNVIGTGANN